MKDIWYEHNGEPHRVVAIEYQDGWPSSVLTECHWDHTGEPWFKPGHDKPNGTCAYHWDFDWCKAEKSLYFHNCGQGGKIDYHVGRSVQPVPPKAQLWVAEGVPILAYSEGGKRERRVRGATELLKRGYQLIDQPLRLPCIDYMACKTKTTMNPFYAGWEGETVWCTRCQSSHPCEDTNNPCEHIAWCDGCANWIYSESRTWVEDERSTCDCKEDDDDED